jgi:two-component system NtrC family sensor kinase
VDGQAEVVAERCIGCGNCVRVCSQKAKKVLSIVPEARALLAQDRPVAAIIAPSFPAEFSEMGFETFVGMVRALGFSYVHEVGFGADMVANAMRQLLESDREKRYISSACPAVFGYIKRYHPELIDHIAPVVSPMIAMARVVRALHGPDVRIIFIGPCIAKKIEAVSREVSHEIDEVLTFSEFRQMVRESQIQPNRISPSDFDPPFSGKGSLFPIGRGLLEAADIHEDLISGDVISANGKENFINAIMEFSSGDVDARLLDVLCCDGCIMGSGMTQPNPPFKRRALVSQYAREIVQNRNHSGSDISRFDDIDLTREFLPNDQRIRPPDLNQIREVLQRMGKTLPEDELNCGACGYETCVGHAVAICKGLAEIDMCLPHTIDRLHQTVHDLNDSNHQLARTRQALIHSEKMASMGQLSAGIAHEVNNPLGVVLMYAHLMKDAIEQNPDLQEDVDMIVEHADRAKKIVSGLLHFARQNKVDLKPTHVPDLIEDCVKSIDLPSKVTLDVNHKLKDPIAMLDRDQMIQVIVNFINNSLTAMPEGGLLSIHTSGSEKEIQITVKDTGVGIPEELRDKVFEPFFTTKGIGEGTGLGLAITYGIVKMHNGDLKLESNNNPAAGPTGSAFTVVLPRKTRSV